MKIEGEIAVVTGGASGLGEATVRALADKGAKVAVLDMNEEQAKEVAASVGGIAVSCNVSDAAGAENAIAQITVELGAPRICVNAAGVGPTKLVVGKSGPMPLASFANVIDINLIGTFNIMRLVAAEMAKLEPTKTGERGVIINVASIAAYDGQMGQTAYAASKGAVASLTLPAARELARHGIRVMTIAPGIFETPLLHTLPEAIQKALGDSVPFPNRLGQPAEFARLVKDIVENAMLNGEVIRLDGAVRLAAS